MIKIRKSGIENVSLNILAILNDNRGSIDLYRHRDNIWIMTRIFVFKDIRGQGVAKALMDELVKVADENDYIILTEVSPYLGQKVDYTRLANFFQRYGFDYFWKGLKDMMVRMPCGTKIDELIEEQEYKEIYGLLIGRKDDDHIWLSTKDLFLDLETHYKVMLQLMEDGRYRISLPALPECLAEDESIDGAVLKVIEEIKQHIEKLKS